SQAVFTNSLSKAVDDTQPRSCDVASSSMAASHGFTLFDTAIGSCGIAWRGETVVGVQLPEADAEATRARLRRRFPEAGEATPPARLQRIVDALVRLLEGADSD